MGEDGLPPEVNFMGVVIRCVGSAKKLHAL